MTTIKMPPMARLGCVNLAARDSEFECDLYFAGLTDKQVGKSG